MSQPQNPPRPADAGLSPWHYLLIFTAFALAALVLVSKKYERRQPQFEQQFRGINEMERHRPMAGGPLPGATSGAGAQSDLSAAPAGQTPTDDAPLLISLRPIMIVLAVLMGVAWAAIQWRRFRGLSGGRMLAVKRSSIEPKDPSA